MTASPSDEHAGDDHGDRATPLWGTQLDVKVLLWLCASLLGEGMVLRSTFPAPGSVHALLEHAETELRRFPIGDYPAGTIDVVIGLCDLIRETRP